MNTGIRFSSPTIDDDDYKILAQDLNIEINETMEIIENAPYEVSILISLLHKIEQRIK